MGPHDPKGHWRGIQGGNLLLGRTSIHAFAPKILPEQSLRHTQLIRVAPINKVVRLAVIWINPANNFAPKIIGVGENTMRSLLSWA